MSTLSKDLRLFQTKVQYLLRWSINNWSINNEMSLKCLLHCEFDPEFLDSISFFYVVTCFLRTILHMYFIVPYKFLIINGSSRSCNLLIVYSLRPWNTIRYVNSNVVYIELWFFIDLKGIRFIEPWLRCWEFNITSRNRGNGSIFNGYFKTGT